MKMPIRLFKLLLGLCILASNSNCFSRDIYHLQSLLFFAAFFLKKLEICLLVAAQHLVDQLIYLLGHIQALSLRTDGLKKN